MLVLNNINKIVLTNNGIKKAFYKLLGQQLTVTFK